jgi:hypothetical protein
VLEHFAAVRRQARRVGASDRLECEASDEEQRPRRAEEGLCPVQKDPGTDVIRTPLSVQPQSTLLHVTGVEGGLVMSPVTSVSNTHAPASAPDELPLDEPLEEPPEELLDDPPEELLDDPLDELLPEELLEDTLDESTMPPSRIGFGLVLLLLPHAVGTRPVIAAATITVQRANALRIIDGLMCRSHSRPGWAS